VSQPDPTGEPPVTTAKPPARYGAIGGARPGGFALPSYTITGDTTGSHNGKVIAAYFAGHLMMRGAMQGFRWLVADATDQFLLIFALE
jgi:hypothetical protein